MSGRDHLALAAWAILLGLAAVVILLAWGVL